MSERLRKSVGDSIRKFRKELGMTQKELCEKTGLKQSNLSAVENGKGNLSLKQVDKIAAALGKEADVLFT